MMLEKRVKMNKKQNTMDKGVTMPKKKGDRNQNKKLKQMMKKRLIIRNLSFKVSEEKLKEIFSEFGEVLEAKIPLDKDGRKRGFAFIGYKDTKSQFKAMKALNFKKIDGRPVAIDFAIDKTTYQSGQQNKKSSSSSSVHYSESDKMRTESDDSRNEDVKPEVEPQSDISDDEEEADDNNKTEDKKVKSFLKEFDADASDDDNLEDSLDESSDEGENNEETESHHSDETANTSDIAKSKKQSQDVSEGKTIFIRNISFKNSEEDLQEIMQEYGKTEYCLLCVDPLTDHSKGTAFVKFLKKESADKLLEESSKEPGILLDGRRLMCAYAISREELSKIHEKSTKVKDKRNLGLLKCGAIMANSKEAEGVSQSDMVKRAQLESVKKQKLKNMNFFVSDKRVIIHNLPKNIQDKDLMLLFRKAAGKGAFIKEARVMRDFKKTDAQGIPVSKGFGFVSFTQHDHALEALTQLNNNPNIFTSQKRPIVEFSVENKEALLSQQRRREKIQMRNKKRMEEKLNPYEDKQMQSPQKTAPNKKIKKRKNKSNNSPNKKMKQNYSNDVQSSENTEARKSKKKQKTNKNKKGAAMNNQDSYSLSQLTNKYKEKLLNKFS